ncbi:hypothetical protein NNC19_06105 [Clostridium sp. SHJSY1]|uniref:hypothetical protein n=1 Tax=Clostridium sp. SHJSY1 TaxID=2942483 RepID=UPI002875557C|nr:hypothetical protein [Clostridium sp. SHJSY1]MDS0525248.1 hypothetical protein [Clostridium sp. SHJSY1]
MGFRFRKAKSFRPLRINHSKSKDVEENSKTDDTLIQINYNSYNKKNNNKPKEPFYNKTWFLWLSLIFFPPLGMFLLWKNKKYTTKTRYTLYAVFSVYTLLLIINPESNQSTKTKNYITQGQSSNIYNNDSSEDTQAKEDEKKAQEQATAQEAEKQKVAQEQAAAQEAEKQKVAQEQAAIQEAEKQKVAQQQAAIQETEKQKAAQQQAAIQEAEKQKAIQQQNTTTTQQNNGQAVYVATSGEGHKYHSNPNCSHMNGTRTLSKSEAEKEGYTACKKCY